jgi:putative DNA primase/helicase
VTISPDDQLRVKNVQTAIQRIKAISGQDRIQVQIKNKTSIVMTIPTRLLFVTNEVPSLPDVSGSLTRRFLFLKFNYPVPSESVDSNLSDKLMEELPAILNWALTGLERLNTRGGFVLPESSKSDMELFSDMGSPMKMMIRQICKVGPTEQCTRREMRYVAGLWFTQHDIHMPAAVWFSRDLSAAEPSVIVGNQAGKITINGRRENAYRGISIDYDAAAEILGETVRVAAQDNFMPGPMQT